MAGYWADNDVVITAVTQAGSLAHHEPDRYEPDARYDDEQVALLYRESDRSWTYLGDWHSHPTRRARLSELDRRTLRTIADTPTARLARPVMVIATIVPEPQIAVWVFDQPAADGKCYVRRATLHSDEVVIDTKNS